MGFTREYKGIRDGRRTGKEGAEAGTSGVAASGLTPGGVMTWGRREGRNADAHIDSRVESDRAVVMFESAFEFLVLLGWLGVLS